MCVTWGIIRRTVRSRPISSIAPSPVTSNARIAQPYWKPCVHSVHPREVYRPSTVKTGVPLAGSHVFSMLRTLVVASSNTRSMAGASDLAERSVLIFMVKLGVKTEEERRPAVAAGGADAAPGRRSLTDVREDHRRHRRGRHRSQPPLASDRDPEVGRQVDPRSCSRPSPRPAPPT